MVEFLDEGGELSSKNHTNGMAALGAATDGSICVRSKRLPRDFADLAAALRDSEARVQLIICGPQPPKLTEVVLAPIKIPAAGPLGLDPRDREDARFLAEAVARAYGNVQHAVQLRKQLAALGPEQRRAAQYRSDSTLPLPTIATSDRMPTEECMVMRDSNIARAIGALVAVVPACFHPVWDHPICGPSDACPDDMICVHPQNVCESKHERNFDSAAAFAASHGLVIADGSVPAARSRAGSNRASQTRRRGSASADPRPNAPR